MSKIKITIICLIVICSTANVMAGCWIMVGMNRCSCGTWTNTGTHNDISCSLSSHQPYGMEHMPSVGSEDCSSCEVNERIEKVEDFTIGIRDHFDFLAGLTKLL